MVIATQRASSQNLTLQLSADIFDNPLAEVAFRRRVERDDLYATKRMSQRVANVRLCRCERFLHSTSIRVFEYSLTLSALPVIAI
jgi:hypothetical protein